jgi:hypothetical protein
METFRKPRCRTDTDGKNENELHCGFRYRSAMNLSRTLLSMGLQKAGKMDLDIVPKAA